MGIRLTIVTPTLNRCSLLREALKSVSDQAHCDVEHIVVDGGSTDGTLEMLTFYPDIRVLQDRRRGLYDAINVGIEHARGDVIGILNSDDVYTPCSFQAVDRAFTSNPDVDSVCGVAETFDRNGVIRSYSDLSDLVPDAHAVLLGACIINARFFRKQLFGRLGPFSLEFPRVADREFLARAVRHNMKTVNMPDTVYRYRVHKGSLTFSPDVAGSDSLRLELLSLARTISGDSDWPAKLKWKALSLEGRCLVALTRLRLRAGDLPGAVNVLFGDKQLHPVAIAIGCALIDRLIGRKS